MGKLRTIPFVAALLAAGIRAAAAPAPVTGPAPHWERVTLAENADLALTLLVRPTASVADEAFIGFELSNKTNAPLAIDQGTNYRLEGRRIATSDGRSFSSTGLASGNSYDLLWRETARPGRRDGPWQPDTIPPGATTRLRYSSAQVLGVLGRSERPREIEGTAHAHVGLRNGTTLETPEGGVPFRFTWTPVDEAGLAAVRQRLVRVLREPSDEFADAFVLRTLLADGPVASAADVPALLEGMRRHDQVSRPVIVAYVNSFDAQDPRVLEFVLDVVSRRDRLLFMQLAAAGNVRDPRLIEPLVQWIRDDVRGQTVTPAALAVLARHRDLMRDRAATTAELGRLVLDRSPLVASGKLPAPAERWRWLYEVERLAMTGDRSLVRTFVPYLGMTDVLVDARQIEVVNDGVSTRACDVAYNAILDLLDRAGERFAMKTGLQARRPNPADREHARRDALIARLRQELDPNR